MAAENPTMKLDPKYDDYDYPTTSPNVQSGHPGHLTPEQDAQVHQLRMILEQLGYKERLDTLTLLRFLRARKFNVELSKQMFIDSEKWRKEFGVDDLVRNFKYEEKPQVFAYYPQYYHKTDKAGRPVYIEQLGKIDLAAMYKITTAERMLQNLVVEYEKLSDPRLPACARKSGNLLETCCSIMDMKGVGLAKANSAYNYVRQATTLSQNYYPERLGKLYVINAPWGFSTVFSVVKGFLDPVTVDKIHILGSNYQAELLAQVPKENLPTQFGGTCTCPGGCELSDDGPWKDPQWVRPPKWAKQAADPSANTATATATATTTTEDDERKEKTKGEAATESAPAPAPAAGAAPIPTTQSVDAAAPANGTAAPAPA
ncbi:MAG: cytosolic factor, phosphatidylinositol/phosphatidylcholine transfer protein [Sarcosagium campestre]|nr:MAG: cytosolic factor, phosphatidylinositol/phosphatidylcholine transfer protein [Sarcosagium campestre]